jgi:hypothetical protein
MLPREAGRPGLRLDPVGLALLSPGPAGMIHGLTAAADGGTLAPVRVLGPAHAGTALVLAFRVRALTVDHPPVDLRPLRRRQLAVATGTLSLYFAGAFALMPLTPLYFQLARGESAAGTGPLLSRSAGGLVTMPLAGHLVDRAGPRAVALTGMSSLLAGTTGFLVAMHAGAPARRCAARSRCWGRAAWS